MGRSLLGKKVGEVGAKPLYLHLTDECGGAWMVMVEMEKILHLHHSNEQAIGAPKKP